MTTITAQWTDELKAIADELKAIADAAAFQHPAVLEATSTRFLVTVVLPRLTEAGLDRTAVLREIERRATR